MIMSPNLATCLSKSLPGLDGMIKDYRLNKPQTSEIVKQQVGGRGIVNYEF
jgi:hypothetical protein